MERRPTAARGQRAYDNFVPSHEVVREKDAEIFLIQLPGFKKEDIKIQINDYGQLKISGQRPLADNRWSRFLKELKVPDYCNVSEIKAKFEDGLLYIIKPILATKPGADGMAPETTTLDGKGTREKKADDDSKNGVSQKTKTKPKREESDGGVNNQSNEKKESLDDAGKDVQKVSEKERGGRIEGPKYSGKVAAKHEGGRNGARMTESRKEEEAVTPELTSAERGNMRRNLTIVRGFYTRKQLMLNPALAAAIVILAGVVLLFYVTR
ncbi:inactive protein RESTRICTED TEV MOVEMENT 2 [Musa acuminata AAA Group]|uniref:inactive protein RESTRICTED TEV MOVEMENT 2 n=1 Tax=Musa acuminata AAA Group TaxID=214697 RepID=UPI0031E3CED8